MNTGSISVAIVSSKLSHQSQDPAPHLVLVDPYECANEPQPLRAGDELVHVGRQRRASIRGDSRDDADAA
jgi:hypothetical protein